MLLRTSPTESRICGPLRTGICSGLVLRPSGEVYRLAGPYPLTEHDSPT